MEIIINIILLATSGSAAVYCFVLNKKLDTLRKTENGLGASVAAMSKSIDDAREAVRDANAASSQSIKELAPLIEESKAIYPKLNELIDIISELSEIAVSEIGSAKDQANAHISSLLQEASAKSDELRAEIGLTDELISTFTEDDSEDESDDTVVFVDDEPPSKSDVSARLGNAVDRAQAMKNQRAAGLL